MKLNIWDVKAICILCGWLLSQTEYVSTWDDAISEILDRKSIDVSLNAS